MCKDAQQADTKTISPKIIEKIKELAELVALENYGPQGPPLELTFREIEQLGHEVGQLAATTVDSLIQTQHADHFQQPQACPQCGQACQLAGKQLRRLLTRYGEATLDEPCFRCHACERAFFPSAYHAAN